MEPEYRVSGVPGYDRIELSGTVKDKDIGDRLSVLYSLKEESDDVLLEGVVAYFVANGTEQAFDFVFPMDASIPEGVYKLEIWVKDQLNGMSDIKTATVTVDKTAPTVSFSPSQDTIVDEGQPIDTTIHAEDEGTNVERIWYTIRNSATEQVELQDLTQANGSELTLTLTEGKSYVYAAAEDEVGNVSPIHISPLSHVNAKPVIEIEQLNRTTFSEVAGFNQLELGGHVQDRDAGGELRIAYSLKDAQGLLTAHENQMIGTLLADGTSQPFAYSLPIDDTIPEGNVILELWVEDDAGLRSDVVTLDFLVNKTAPTGAMEVNRGAVTVQEIHGELMLLQANASSSVIPYRVQLTLGLTPVKEVRVSTSIDFQEDSYVYPQGETPLEGEIRMPLDEEGGRVKTIFVQLEDEVGNISEEVKSYSRRISARDFPVS